MESHFWGHILEAGACLWKFTHLGINCDLCLIGVKVKEEFMGVELERTHAFSFWNGA